ncbi:nitroreductase family protein [Nocardioides sp. SYSU D00038]|uniref:nitroreductase family protein n=1 Tax=Nocardioides sp. SYSU D00038 TaxID=2812554 RepID=UPI001966FB65|nr:nitroreductase family protein [Nocardioides sp. SYSU D00038]
MSTRVIADVDEVLTTTRAVRRRLDLERPVPREVVEECLELALQAPMGSNLEHWRFVAVDDPEVKLRIAELYREIWVETVEAPLAGGEAATVTRLSPTTRADEATAARQQRVLDSVKHLVDRLEQVPVLVVVCSVKPLPDEIVGGRASGYYGSIFPAVWSFQLALRSRGLGSVLATALAHRAEQVAKVLELPEDCRVVTLVPVAYTQGLEFGRGSRGPVSDVLAWNGWGERA